MPPRPVERRISIGTRLTNIFRLRPVIQTSSLNEKIPSESRISPTSVIQHESEYNRRSPAKRISTIETTTVIIPLDENNTSARLPDLAPMLSEDDDGAALSTSSSSSYSLCSSDKKIMVKHVSHYSYDQKNQIKGIPLQVEIHPDLDGLLLEKKTLTRNTSSLTFSQNDDVNNTENVDLISPLFIGSIKGDNSIKFDFSSSNFSSSSEEKIISMQEYISIPTKQEGEDEEVESLTVVVKEKSELIQVEDKTFVPTQVEIKSTSVRGMEISATLSVDTDWVSTTIHETMDTHNASITCGMYVDIIGGTYKGKVGARVIKVMNKMVRVQIPGDSTIERSIQKGNVQPSRNYTSDIKIALTESENDEKPYEAYEYPNLATVPTMETFTSSPSSEGVKVSSEQSPIIANTSAYCNIKNNEFPIGSIVDVTGGLYRGTKGAIIVKITEKMVRVRLPGTTTEKMIKKQSIQLLQPGNNSHTGMNLEQGEEEENEVRSLDEHLEGLFMDCETDENTELHNTKMGDFRILDGGKSPLMMGNFHMVRVIASTMKPDPACFLEYQWGTRLITKDIRVKENVSIETTIRQYGCILQLISAKVYSENTGFSFQSRDYLRLAYAIVSGPRLQTRWAKEELLKIGDFASLTTSKVVSRLELLQSPAHKLKGKSAIQILDSSLFCNIEEMGHVGCGFISEDMLYKVCGSTPTAKRVTCIQVRLIIPRLGIFKGILMRKKIISGPPIQLPTSMRKVGPSSDPTYAHLAFVLICQAGVDPSSNNLYVGRLPSIDPTAKPPPKSFRVNPLSDMVIRLFQGLQVPSSIVDEYAKQSARVTGLKHAYVRGVADPTGKIPQGYIYLTGIARKEILGETIFITRSPCIKCSDARRLPVIRQRPASMTEDEWTFLESLHFGAVIFGFPNKGFKSLPEMIASGDLDGDRYFVCWSEVILKHIVTDEMENIPAEDEVTKPDISNRAWYEDAQKVMIDSARRNAVGQLIGKLYTLSLKAADESELFMRDPKAIAFADAYNDALDYVKHGNKIFLPHELHERVPEKLRIYLSARDPLL